jgi:hypothetical protein
MLTSMFAGTTELYTVEGTVVIAAARLPRYEEAWIPVEKLRDYALSTESEEGRDKAVVFASALGIQREDWPYLHDQILEELPESPAILHNPDTPWGTTWEVPVLVAGRNASVHYVTTGWIIRPEDPRPQLTTARVARRECVPRLRAVREAFAVPREGQKMVPRNASLH